LDSILEATETTEIAEKALPDNRHNGDECQAALILRQAQDERRRAAIGQNMGLTPPKQSRSHNFPRRALRSAHPEPVEG